MPIGSTGNAIIKKAVARRNSKGQPCLPPEQEAEFRKNVEYLANKHRVPADWILMVFVIESRMDYRADNGKHSGLIQQSRTYWDYFGFDPRMNAVQQTAPGGPIDKSFRDHYGKAKTSSLGTFYLSNVYPIYVNKGADEDLPALAWNRAKQANILYDKNRRITKNTMEAGVIKRTQEFLSADEPRNKTKPVDVPAPTNVAGNPTPTAGEQAVSVPNNEFTIYTQQCLPPTTILQAIIWTGCGINRVVSAVGNGALVAVGAVLGNQSITTARSSTGIGYNGPPVPGGYIMPVGGNNVVFTSAYGPRGGGMHRGIDIAAPIGNPIYAARSGLVTFARIGNGPPISGYGALIIIDHGENPGIPRYTAYAHCQDILVKVGQQVKQGDTIGTVGNRGRSTGPHLHFEIRQSEWGGQVDPLAYAPNLRRGRRA